VAGVLADEVVPVPDKLGAALLGRSSQLGRVNRLSGCLAAAYLYVFVADD
jgi:hypothetical protein